MSGGTIDATAAGISGNGSNNDQNTTVTVSGGKVKGGNIKVNVSSGKLESENGHAVSILRDAAGKGSEDPAVNVVGGTFVSKEDTFRALEPETDVEHVTVRGGIFDHDISRFLTGDDVVVKDANGNWVIADDKEIYVNDNVDGTFVGDYATIQEAIDLIAGAADKDGWTIHVAPGTYTRFAVLPGITHLKVIGTVSDDGSKPVVLVNQENDTLHDTVAKYVYSVMNADGYGIMVLSNDITIENLSIQAGKRIGSWGGTVISGAIQATDGFPVKDQRHHDTDGLVVRNCDFKGSNVGKGVSTYSDVGVYTIEGCKFSNFPDAIWQTDDDGAPQNIIIHNNTFTDCTAAISLQFYSKNVTEDNNGSIVITNNTVTGGPVSDTLVRILDMNDKATVGPEVVPATGHQWIDGTCDICGTKCEHGSYETFGTAVDATCTKPGMTEGTRCTICDAIVIPQRETVPTGHRHIVAAGESKDATCTEPGMTAGEKCQDCDTVITEQEEIPALGHSYKDGQCEHCKALEPECEHENVEVYIEAKDATCTTDGRTEGTWCVDCHAVIKESKVLEATGHSTIAHKAKEPTCTEEGATEEVYCTVCGEVITPSVSIPKLGHKVEILEAKAPTCTAEGLSQGSRCTVCGEVFVKQETVPAAGHKYENGKCTVCGDAQEDPEKKPDDKPEEKPSEPEKKVPHYVVSDTLTHGRLNVDPTLAYPGSEVSVEVIPETGYVVKRIYVAYEMSTHELTKVSENKYTFIMPNENAKIYVEFTKALVPHNFKDVAADSWYNSAVTNLFNRDIVKGISDTEFSPNGKASRGQVVTMLYRLDGENPVSGTVAQFSDVKSDAYYAEAVKWAKANNIVNGINTVIFAPDDNITREQLVTILYRYSQYKKYGTSINQPNAVTGFKDASDISDYATPAMRWAAGNKVIKGYDDNTLKPKNDITRAEICSLLDNYITFNNID